ARVLRGAEATAERVRHALPGRTHVHLATHGTFLPDEVGWLPGLRSGLVLARGEVLSAQELIGLDLSSARLVVLSACETGLGDLSAGEGVLGLQRALHIAGARTAVTSLWSVSDAATALLMERFYDGLEEHPPPEALRRAQAWVKDHPGEVERRGEALRGAGRVPEKLPAGTRRSPVAWWGAFVLSGDWR
ncbi:MAG: CHAT domain-containing protein, partial [Gemmataceae bacterium]|nr:CHAT domain-containing protein [Gemmataceae bacterium]